MIDGSARNRRLRKELIIVLKGHRRKLERKYGKANVAKWLKKSYNEPNRPV